MSNKPVVSIQGGAGSFHHIAAEQVFGELALIERPAFREIFEDVATGDADYGLIAIENSIAGSLIYNFDLLREFNLPIVGETYLRISHHLIALPGVKYEELSEVLSHPMAIQQTRVYLRTLGIKVTEHEDTAGAVADIKKGNRRDLAAVASMRAAELYGMNILKQNIETDPNNYTRFLLISGKEANEFKPDQTLKTSLLFGFSDGPGALVEILQIFAEAEINMTKIESRPRLGSPWRYDFYVDLEMDSRSEPAKRILAKLSSKTSFLRILGTYPLLNGDY